MILDKSSFKFLFVFIFLFCNQHFSFSQKNKTYNLVTDFGAKADNKTDNYNAFIKAAFVISKAGGGILIIPKGNYYIAAYKTGGGPQKNNVTDILFKNCKGLTIEGNNSIIRVNGNFFRNKDYQLDGIPYFYAFNNTVCPIKITNCKNVLIKDLTLYGEVDKMKKQLGVVEGECYGLFIADDEPGDTSNRVVLQNITAHHFAADGFLIRSNGEDIVINKCNLYKNARQGLSIVKGSNIKCLYSTFDSTGATGAYGWHGPGAGIDVENEFGPDKLKNVLIQNCTVRGNIGFQIVTTLPSYKVIIDSCFISDLTAGYSDGLNGVGMYSLNSTLSNSILFATIQVEITDQRYTGELVQQFIKNIIYSGNRGILSADFARPANFNDNILVMLPKPLPEIFFPHIQNPNCRFNRNIIVVHANRIKKEQNPITALVQLTLEARDDFWLMNGYDIPKDKRQKNYYYPALTDTKILKNHFFPPNEKIDLLVFPQKKTLLPAQMEKILTAELFTAYTQRTFNTKFLVQANAARKYTATIVAAVKD